jgi:acyl-CoA dehydrogenase
MTDPYSTALDDLLAQACTPEVVRGIEEGGNWQELWATLQDSGFADALVPESAGGSGLALREVAGVVERCGAHALPVSLPETLVVRAILSTAGIAAGEWPTGPITLASGRLQEEVLLCDAVPVARTATHVVVQAGHRWMLLATDEASEEDAGFALDLSLRWSREALRKAVPLTGLPDQLAVRSLQACIYAAMLAGAAGRVFDMTLAYANQRAQFGRVIGKFQAVQHHLAVMAEQVAAARIAAEIGCISSSWMPDPLRTGVAKARASEAALEVAKLAHQVHGAIGFTGELDLQLFTRRLHAWRRAGDSESAWHDAVGRTLVAGHGGRAVELVCNMLENAS